MKKDKEVEKKRKKIFEDKVKSLSDQLEKTKKINIGKIKIRKINTIKICLKKN